MSSKRSPNEIQSFIERFIELDGMAVEQLRANKVEGLARAIFEGARIERKLLTLLAFHGHVTGDEEAIASFRRQAFSLQAMISELRAEPQDEWDPDLPYMFDPHLNRLIDFEDPDWPEPINERLLKVQVLLTKRPLPTWVVRHLHTLRRCYALEMYEAAWIFARALIEAVSFEWLKQNGSFEGPANVRYIAERNLGQILDMVADRSSVPISDMKTIRQIKNRANKFVHSKRAIDGPSEAETLEAISQVVRYAELLFKSA
jgi:hypothetical protein